MEDSAPKKPGPARRLFRFALRLLVAVLLTLAGVGAVAFFPARELVRGWSRQAIAHVEAHRDHRVAHAGWSFPARLYTEPVPLTSPPWRLIAEARARGYAERCPFPGPGELCERSGAVNPRVPGDALEPLLLGWIVGPTGEIREHLPLAAAPRHLIEAVIAAEDRDFRTHQGVNLVAAARAALANARGRSYAQGGSTLTMQVVRAMVGRREKTLARKLREAVMAYAIDAHLGKDGVLQMYLDAPYLGQRGGLSICGFQAASRHYFAKDARDLSLAEAATLAAILPAPAKFAPDRYPERARERRDRVLKAMEAQFGYEVTKAIAEPLVTVPSTALDERFPAYLSATRAWLEANLPSDVLYGAGLVVTAGVDVVAQQETEAVFATKTRHLETLVGRPPGLLQSAGVLLDAHTGRLAAVWGGFGETATGFNRATQARRQPGSAFKPVVYALALSQKKPDGTPRFTAASTEPNEQRVFKTPQGNWSPRNVTFEYTPTASLAFGLALSQNVATASLLEDLGGPLPLREFARRLGFDTRGFPAEMGLALGQAEVTPLEMAQVAAAIANGGRRVLGRPVVAIVDGSGHDRMPKLAEPEQVLTPEAAALTRELMRLVVDFGTGAPIRAAGDDPGYKGEAMGKTGTTDLERDAWLVGATPKWAAVVWLGHDQPQQTGGSASDLAAPLWGWWMARLTRHDAPLPTFPETPRLGHKWICTVSGKLPGPGCQSLYAPFLPGTEPKESCEEDHTPKPPEEGAPPKAKYEGLWQRLAREKAEREAALDGGTADAAGR